MVQNDEIRVFFANINICPHLDFVIRFVKVVPIYFLEGLVQYLDPPQHANHTPSKHGGLTFLISGLRPDVFYSFVPFSAYTEKITQKDTILFFFGSAVATPPPTPLRGIPSIF